MRTVLVFFLALILGSCKPKPGADPLDDTTDLVAYLDGDAG